MKYQKLLSLALFILVLPSRLLAWGHVGHAMVAELAMSMLSDATKMKVERVLNGMTAADAGNWMDEVRSDPKYKYTAPWHFVNIDEGQSYKPAPNGDIITALNKAYTELQHPEKLTPKQVKFDVLVLFHLCGDLMQPLHVGYGSDKGGNRYQVNYNGKGANLHHMWDNRIIESQDITLSDLQKGQKPQIKKIDFIEWLAESRALLLFVYKLDGHKIDDSYIKRNADLVELQLRDAGSLLAACLEKLFSRMSNIPEGPTTSCPQPARSLQIPVKP